ncbi:hypothetical protein PTKIN_Ptkin10aG0140900 [Pterospermum kingtungense]
MLLVPDLMVPGQREWDIELLQDLFDERYVKEIVNLPLSRFSSHDCRIWHFSKNGSYQVFEFVFYSALDFLCVWLAARKLKLFFKEEQCHGYGIVLRDDQGLVVAAKRLLVPGIPSVCECEALGLAEALSWVHELGF